MTPDETSPIPEGMHAVNPHIVVRGAARAAEWYAEGLAAEERGRVPVPVGRLMSPFGSRLDVRFGGGAGPRKSRG